MLAFEPSHLGGKGVKGNIDRSLDFHLVIPLPLTGKYVLGITFILMILLKAANVFINLFPLLIICVEHDFEPDAS